MSDAIEMRFKIGAYTPATIPMARLAQYMAELSVMIGEQAAVHFIKLEGGSTTIVHAIEPEAYPKVERRVAEVREGTGVVESLDAYRTLNRYLRDDGATADYSRTDSGAELIQFPGVKAPEPLELAPVVQPGTIDGVVQGIGGRGHYAKDIPVYVAAGDVIHSCVAAKTVAIELAHHTFGAEMRFTGTAHWVRDQDGVWTLRRFVILGSETLDPTPLSQIVDELRAIPSGWEGIADPWGDVIALRDDKGEVH